MYLENLNWESKFSMTYARKYLPLCVILTPMAPTLDMQNIFTLKIDSNSPCRHQSLLFVKTQFKIKFKIYFPSKVKNINHKKYFSGILYRKSILCTIRYWLYTPLAYMHTKDIGDNLFFNLWCTRVSTYGNSL